MWSYADIADALHEGLRHEAQQLNEEHAVYGLDALDELELHPFIEAALRQAGFGVHREQRYPADRRKRKESEGERCDFVITPNARALRSPERKATLFDDPNAVNPDEAFWLEVKVVSQFREDGPNRQYASQLLATVRKDVTKLSRDDGILHAALLIILFVQNELVADHDLNVWQDKCLERGLPIAAPNRRTFPIADRMGNSLCSLALYPVRHL